MDVGKVCRYQFSISTRRFLTATLIVAGIHTTWYNGIELKENKQK